MVPPVSDPRWTQFLTKINTIPLNNLVTKMLSTRIRLMNWEQSEVKKREAIAAAYDFFAKNEAMVANDVKLIFG
jgi:hypothetical protein